MEYIKHSKITKYEVDLQRINVCISIYPKEGYFTVTVFRVLSVENEVLIFPFFGPYQEVRTGRVKRFRSHMPLGLTLHEDSPG